MQRILTAEVFGGKNSREKKRASGGREEMSSMILDMLGCRVCRMQPAT
jgi:hypothetical protein